MIDVIIIMGILIYFFGSYTIGEIVKKEKEKKRKREMHAGKEVVEIRYDEYGIDTIYIQETKVKLKKGDKIKVRWPEAKRLTDIYSAKVIKGNYVIDEKKSLELVEDWICNIRPIEVLEVNGEKIEKE